MKEYLSLRRGGGEGGWGELWGVRVRGWMEGRLVLDKVDTEDELCSVRSRGSLTWIEDASAGWGMPSAYFKRTDEVLEWE